MNCTKTRYDRKILCAGAMTHYLDIYKHEAATTDFGSLQANPTKTKITSMFGYFEAVKPSLRFDGVVIDDKTTHLFYIAFDQTIYELDVNKLFCLKYNPARNRIFKLSNIENYGERDQWLMLSLEEQGFADKEATEA